MRRLLVLLQPRRFSLCKPRAYSQSFDAHVASHENGKHRPPVPKPKSFGSLGLHPPIVSALEAAFPNVKQPTKNQARLIPAVLAGRDIFLQDQTGSGKSFGLVLALLNRPRADRRKPSITSIFIVPHRELAYQFYDWVERLFAPVASAPISSIDSIAQVLVRDPGSRARLSENPPHLLLATPQALMDAWREQPGALQCSIIVVDEADYLIQITDQSTSRKSGVLKQKQHRGETQEFLNLVYGNDVRPISDEYTPPDSPQLIISSATLPPHLVEYVSEESGWLNRDDWVMVSGASSELRPRELKSPITRSVSHSVLVVGEDEVRNIAGATSPYNLASVDFNAGDEDEGADPVVDMDPALVEKYLRIESPFNPLALETIATIFATEVPSTALLVIPSNSPVQRAIFELRGMGVNAHGLDVLKKRPSSSYRAVAVRANPTLLISTWANTRGLDVRDLSHVFVLGIPSGGATAYVHIAGRVGRLESGDKRRKGKVVMVVGPRDEDTAGDLLKSVNCEPVIQPVPL